MGKFLAPSTVLEVTDALADYQYATLLAGGTDLMAQMMHGRRELGDVVSLRRLAPELSQIEPTYVGAMTTWSQLRDRAFHSAIREAARAVGSPQIRNRGTLGGNLATASAAGDSLPVLAALDASVELVSTRGTRTLSVCDFVIGPKQHAGEPDEMILGVTIPSNADSLPQSFAKIGRRSAMVIAQVSACAVLWENRLRLAFGAVGPTVIALEFGSDVVSRLRDGDPDSYDHVVETSRASVAPITDHRASREYRVHAAAVLARRLAHRVTM